MSGTDTPGALGGETSGKSRRWPGRSWGMSRAGGAAGRARRALGVWGWSGEDLGLEEGGAAHERSPRLSRSLGEREPAGEGAGSWGGPARWAGLVWVSRHLFFPRYFAVFRHLVLLMVVPVTTCFWTFGLTVQRVGS